MGKIAFVFSGQGDQYPGMGRELADKYPAAAKVYEICDNIRPGTSRQCFEGTDEELKETKNTQPCLFATELATAAALTSQIDPAAAAALTCPSGPSGQSAVKAGPSEATAVKTGPSEATAVKAGPSEATAVKSGPDAVAGFSLGEVAAAAFAGIFSLETGFRLVCRRGELMQQEADKFDTAMAAVVKLDEQQVRDLCDQFSGIYPVNFNCPGQITVSGLSSQMPGFFAKVKEAGGRALPLKVKGAFHSPFMEEAARSFREELSRAEIRSMTIPLYSNVTARLYDGDVAGLLSRQIASPVQWEKIIRNMIADGFDTFIEIGPGRTLTNIIKKTDPSVRAVTAAEYMGSCQEGTSC